MADSRQKGLDAGGQKQPASRAMPFEDRSAKRVPQKQSLARTHLAGGAADCLDDALTRGREKQKLDPRARPFTDGLESPGADASVVGDEQIPRGEEGAELIEAGMHGRLGRAQNQKARLTSRDARMSGNLSFGQPEVVVGEACAAGISRVLCRHAHPV